MIYTYCYLQNNTNFTDSIFYFLIQKALCWVKPQFVLSFGAIAVQAGEKPLSLLTATDKDWQKHWAFSFKTLLNKRNSHICVHPSLFVHYISTRTIQLLGDSSIDVTTQSLTASFLISSYMALYCLPLFYFPLRFGSIWTRFSFNSWP